MTKQDKDSGYVIESCCHKNKEKLVKKMKSKTRPSLLEIYFEIKCKDCGEIIKRDWYYLTN